MTKDEGNPQLEDGYTKIANELLDKLAMTHLAPNAWRVIIFIIRKTYGYHKKVDYIANSQIVEGTGLCKAVVSRCLRTLHTQNLIVKNGNKLGLQKNYMLWQKLALPSTSISDSSIKVSDLVNSKKLAESSTELTISSTKVSSCDVTQYKKTTKQNKCSNELLHVLEVLKTTRGYPYDEEKDIDFLQDLQTDFPTVDLLGVSKDFRTYHLDKPIKPGHNPRNQLRNFCKNAVKYAVIPAYKKPYQQAAEIKTQSEATKQILEMQE